MTKPICFAITVLALCALFFAQDAAYYKAIQKGSSSQVRPDEFKKIEERALKDYSNPESYGLLASSFGNTTEKVWAVIYGELYCNLSADADGINKMGSLVFQWYAQSISRNGDNISVDFTENAQASSNQTPFESQFELSFLMGGAALGNELQPLSIRALAAIRKNQLSLWSQKKMPQTELVRRQQAILSAGHFESYNYWLFKGARPDEFNQWLQQHQTEFQAWLNWQSANKFNIQKPDFQRFYLLRNARRQQD